MPLADVQRLTRGRPSRCSLPTVHQSICPRLKTAGAPKNGIRLTSSQKPTNPEGKAGPQPVTTLLRLTRQSLCRSKSTSLVTLFAKPSTLHPEKSAGCPPNISKLRAQNFSLPATLVTEKPDGCDANDIAQTNGLGCADPKTRTSRSLTAGFPLRSSNSTEVLPNGHRIRPTHPKAVAGYTAQLQTLTAATDPSPSHSPNPPALAHRRSRLQTPSTCPDFFQPLPMLSHRLRPTSLKAQPTPPTKLRSKTNRACSSQPSEASRSFADTDPTEVISAPTHS
jgi:hypothetical protein